MNYYMMHYRGIKKVDEKTYLRKTDPDKLRDIITWYDDGKNIFFGASDLDERDVIYLIFRAIDNISIDFCEWGI